MPATLVFIKDEAGCGHCRVTAAAMRAVRPKYTDVPCAAYDLGAYSEFEDPWPTMRADIVSHFSLTRKSDLDYVASMHFVPIILLVNRGAIVQRFEGAQDANALHAIFKLARAS